MGADGGGGQPGSPRSCPQSPLSQQRAGHSGGRHSPGRGAPSLASTDRKERSAADSVEPAVPPSGVPRMNSDTVCHLAAQSPGPGGSLPARPTALGWAALGGAHLPWSPGTRSCPDPQRLSRPLSVSEPRGKGARRGTSGHRERRPGSPSRPGPPAGAPSPAPATLCSASKSALTLNLWMPLTETDRARLRARRHGQQQMFPVAITLE